MQHVTAVAPGRVNLIGDHTDYMGGLAMPIAVDMCTVVRGRRDGELVHIESAELPGTAEVPLGGGEPPARLHGWVRLVWAVVGEVRPRRGFRGSVSTELPIGSGLSSSAALEVSLALALGHSGDPLDLALSCQRAERLAWGVPSGLMDQLCSAGARSGHAMLIDFADLTWTHVPLPEDLAIYVVDSGTRRTVADTAYAERQREAREAEAFVGPLRQAGEDALVEIPDDRLRRRARHVVTENGRVRAAAEALASCDLREFGRLLTAGHESLRRDFEVSTPVLDGLVSELVSMRGVYGARLTGAGFGGSLVVAAEPGALDHLPQARRVRASAGALVSES
ncbi:MAG: galactokinase [Acidimicrobiales bacterium]|nr:MAG: galactokinase [Acidimicrobiales bacterium]